ncbi:hypothetical protein PENSPDRAFT_48711 [Peniophora sp. CONT]|nr:hypothetical protein PENSPDRAFT_48711 [Peniophora sp. CONT]
MQHSSQSPVLQEVGSPATCSDDRDALYEELEHALQQLKLDQSRNLELITRYSMMKGEFMALEETQACLHAENEHLRLESQRIRNELARIDLNDPRRAHVWLALFESFARFSAEVVPRHLMQQRVWMASLEAWSAGRRMLRAQINDSASGLKDAFIDNLRQLLIKMRQRTKLSVRVSDGKIP